MKKLSIILITSLFLSSAVSGQNAPADFIKEMYKLYQSGEYKNHKKAIIDLENKLNEFPKDPNLMALLSLTYLHLSYRDWHFGVKDMDYVEAALNLAKRGEKINDKNYLVNNALATASMLKGDRAAARKYVDKSIKAQAKLAESWYIRACLSEGSIVDENTEAGKNLKKALELDKTLVFALEDKIMAHLKANQVAEAQKTYELYVESYAGNSNALFFKGMILVYSGKLDEARVSLEKFVQKNQGSNLSRLVNFYLN